MRETPGRWPIPAPFLSYINTTSITFYVRHRVRALSALIFLHGIRADMKAALRPKNTKVPNQSLWYAEQNSNTVVYGVFDRPPIAL